MPPLPEDYIQPWEALDAQGNILPAAKGVSCINAASEFRPGVEREASSLVGVADNGEAARLTSGDAGSGETAWAYWRLTMGGEQPGAVSADVNMLPMSDGGESEFYFGLSDYAGGQWQWRGPFSESHIRLSLAEFIGAGSDFLSPLGNLFICVVVCSGSTVDVVGVAANPADEADTTAPPVPAGLQATPVAGGLELGWQPVIAADLAGYRVYWRDGWFLDQQATGIRYLDLLEGLPRRILRLSNSVPVYVRVSAIDICGNESDLSELISATPLAGNAPTLQLTASAPSGMLNDTIALTASGADSYDWDLDGDGMYEVTGDASGSQQADTSGTGLIRPAVRGSITGGSAVACGSVSLIVSGNARPVANGYADPSYGPAPLIVEFTGAGTDPDGEIVLYSWDFDGNGSYDWSDAANSNPPPQTYNMPYMRNVKFRIDDDQGAYDVDTVSVEITAPLPGPNDAPAAVLLTDRITGYEPFTITFFGADSSDPDGSIVLYEWDYDGDGGFEKYGTSPTTQYSFPTFGNYLATLRVTDDRGATDVDSLLLTLPSEWWMFGMGPEHTRRSSYLGAQTSNVRWSFPTGAGVYSSPAIGADGTVYVGSQDGNLYAINPDGTEKWSFTIGGWIRSSPAVGPDGTVYVGCDDDMLFAVNPDGSEYWSLLLGADVRSSPAVGPDGTVYVGCSNSNLYAIHPEGVIKWAFATGGLIQSSPALGPDGTVYVGSFDNNIYAVNPDGSEMWSNGTSSAVFSSPAIASDGTIYVGCFDGKLYAFNTNGTLKWICTTGDLIYSSPAIAADGTVYVGNNSGDLYAISAEGTPLGGNWPFPAAGDIWSSPAIGADGTIYFGSFSNWFYAVNPDGSLAALVILTWRR